MAFDYDVKDPAPTSLMDAQSYRDKAGGAVWGNWTLNCDLSQGDKLPEKYIRVGSPNANYDLKTYDVGAIHICTEGASAATVGYIFVEYVVDLYTPQVNYPLSGSEAYTSNATHIFLATTITDPEGFYPYYTANGQVMYFTQNWQGLLVLKLTGTDVANLTAVMTGPALGAVAANHMVCNAAATVCVATWQVNAVPGSILTFTPTVTTATLCSVNFASGSYLALNWTAGVGDRSTSTMLRRGERLVEASPTISSSSSSSSSTTMSSPVPKLDLSASNLQLLADIKRSRSH
jgi:hypothetical protein